MSINCTHCAGTGVEPNADGIPCGTCKKGDKSSLLGSTFDVVGEVVSTGLEVAGDVLGGTFEVVGEVLGSIAD